MKRKTKNKCYCTRVVTLIIVFKNIYQIFRPITLLKHMLITNQYVATNYCLKVQSCKLNNSKYVIASIQITNTEIFAFISVLVFNLLSRKVLFINRKDNRNC